MATTKPRFTITLSPTAEDLLIQVCERRGQSKAKVIESLIRLLVDDAEHEERLAFWDDMARIRDMNDQEKERLRLALNRMHDATLSRMGLL